MSALPAVTSKTPAPAFRASQGPAAIDAHPTFQSGSQVLPGELEYGEVLGFLIGESSLLDDLRYGEWLEQLTDDIIYQLPLWTPLDASQGKEIGSRGYYLDERKATLSMRVTRELLTFSRNHDLIPHVSRLVSNLSLVREREGQAYRATSSLIVVSSQYRSKKSDTLATKRIDVIRRTSGGLKIAKRTILVNHPSLDHLYFKFLM